MITPPTSRPPPMKGSIDDIERSSPGAGMAKRRIPAKPISMNSVSSTGFECLNTPKKKTAKMKNSTAGWENTCFTVKCCMVLIKLPVSKGRNVSVVLSTSCCLSMERSPCRPLTLSRLNIKIYQLSRQGNK